MALKLLPKPQIESHHSPCSAVAELERYVDASVNDIEEKSLELEASAGFGLKKKLARKKRNGIDTSAEDNVIVLTKGRRQ